MLANRLHRLRERAAGDGRLRRRTINGPVLNNNMVDFRRNDYLGLANHPAVKSAFIQGADSYGLGSKGSPLLNGYTQAHQELEQAVAEFTGRESALLFNSGYQANLAVMTALAGRHDRIIADKQVHASITDGCLLSRASFSRYEHQNLEHLHRLINQHHNGMAFGVTESVFSMSGELTRADEFCRTLQHNNGAAIIDDAHGFGVLGDHGAGVTDYYQLRDQPDVLILPLGKAFGSMGAIVVGSDLLIDTLVNYARPYIYSTAIAPAIAEAGITNLELIKSSHNERRHLRQLSCYFNQAAEENELKLASHDLTPIKAIIIGDNRLTMQTACELAANNILVSAIRPPTVKDGSALIRISLNSCHQFRDIDKLIEVIANVQEQVSA